MALLAACDALAVEPIRPGQESSLIRAVFADRHLWLLSDAGQLSAIADNGNERVPYDLSTPVLDLCASDGHPMIITGGDNRTWALRRWTNQAWSTVKQVPTVGDDLIALSCATEATTLLTSKRLIEIGQDGQLHTVQLRGKLPPGIVMAIHRQGDHIFVSINGGEWGGGLSRIDEKTGAIVSIERNDSGELCGGPLNSGCDPSNGIAAEPWNPRCFAVAVGLVHMMMHGRIVEICGKSIRPLYTKTFVSDDWGVMSKGRKPPSETIAFFGITSSNGSLWAVGADGLYRIDSDGKATITPLPAFKTIDHIKVSFKYPQLILVMTDVNQRRSLSGSVPMLVPR
ncbi:hypothetical protein [Dyella sp. GSA-30]|uniref:hypothetical protein n=1 Tax=Dyella sp. GSA-30 TaxID=2994496 RepID=UPI00248F4A32|nr:hypothetical protein [Dyella sp. GSA-30]BDU20075.1 hypothetical protein DYGSA30_15320 [Dyella sp. GSA-30]